MGTHDQQGNGHCQHPKRISANHFHRPGWVDFESGIYINQRYKICLYCTHYLSKAGRWYITFFIFVAPWWWQKILFTVYRQRRWCGNGPVKKDPGFVAGRGYHPFSLPATEKKWPPPGWGKDYWNPTGSSKTGWIGILQTNHSWKPLILRVNSLWAEGEDWKCMDAIELEDIYLPTKRSEKPRWCSPRKGLDEWHNSFWRKRIKVSFAAGRFISDRVADEEEALQGARGHHCRNRPWKRKIAGIICAMCSGNTGWSAQVVKTKAEEATVYKDYFEFSEPSNAARRIGIWPWWEESRKACWWVFIDIDGVHWIGCTANLFYQGEAADQISMAIADGYKRLMVLHPLKTRIRNEYKEKADEEAIKVFQKICDNYYWRLPWGKKATLFMTWFQNRM